MIAVTILDLVPAPMVPAGGHAHPDDVAVGVARDAHISRVPEGDALFGARFYVASCCWDWHLATGVTEDAVVVVSELVANALRHATWPAHRTVVLVRLALLGRRLTIEVRDPDPAMPRWPGSQRWDLSVISSDADPDSDVVVHGRGLALVQALCEDLAALHEPGGKVVRAVLRLP